MEPHLWKYDGKYGVDSLSYEESFKYLFNPEEGFQDFNQWAQQRRFVGRSAHIMDLMGRGDFMEDYDSMLGIALTEFRSQEERAAQKNKKIIVGNLYQGKIWGKIKKYLTERNFSGFDLIVCRPLGPFVHKAGFECKFRQEYLEIYFKLLQRAYNLLSPDNGIILTELPEFKGRQELDKAFCSVWMEKLECAGVKVKFDCREQDRGSICIRMDKSSASPQDLPDVMASV